MTLTHAVAPSENIENNSEDKIDRSSSKVWRAKLAWGHCSLLPCITYLWEYQLFFCLRSFSFLPLHFSVTPENTNMNHSSVLTSLSLYSVPNQLSQSHTEGKFLETSNLLFLQAFETIYHLLPFPSSSVYVSLILPTDLTQYSQWALTIYMVLYCWLLSQSLPMIVKKPMQLKLKYMQPNNNMYFDVFQHLFVLMV